MPIETTPFFEGIITCASCGKQLKVELRSEITQEQVTEKREIKAKVTEV